LYWCTIKAVYSVVKWAPDAIPTPSPKSAAPSASVFVILYQ
jgi:hypothetical protein